jgi:hypothetical protein
MASVMWCGIKLLNHLISTNQVTQTQQQSGVIIGPHVIDAEWTEVK